MYNPHMSTVTADCIKMQCSILYYTMHYCHVLHCAVLGGGDRRVHVLQHGDEQRNYSSSPLLTRSHGVLLKAKQMSNKIKSSLTGECNGCCDEGLTLYRLICFNAPSRSLLLLLSPVLLMLPLLLLLSISINE
jgi:hypothetical protein